MRNEVIQTGPPVEEATPSRQGRSISQWLSDIESRVEAMEARLQAKLRRKLEGMKRERSAG
ncbi:hypothetical protein ACYFX5_15745 [Bremerella sp. T1]|uniref:hypothetical protein n=1 Tax=Bremerella sp. TYQ1 TaxID=3119568 RepID=UPI001CC96625|nr:hypothetical protein [Bremerella volcania]UBM34509.1 hypothetical protein LA756_17695 [Bremerella volcania]